MRPLRLALAALARTLDTFKEGDGGSRVGGRECKREWREREREFILEGRQRASK